MNHDRFAQHGGNEPKAAAFTIVEAVLSTVIVAVMFVAALNTVGTSRVTQQRAAMTSRGRLFAEMLLSEVLQQNYKDPGASPLFGPEAGESTVTRADFDDVDDYNGWSGVPTAKDGTALPNSTGWTQAVTVEWIDRLNPSQVQPAETNAKRITVTTKFNNVPQVTLVAIRTAAQ
jgi:type II secretory pathway pseudopilin PulG